MFQGPFFAFFFLGVGAVSLFGFLAVASWAGCRQQERESYYKNDMLKKLADSDTGSAAATIEYLREKEKIAEIRRDQKKREGYSLGGLINIAVGIALMALLTAISHKPEIGLFGLVPFLIGVALLVHVYLSSPKQTT